MDIGFYASIKGGFGGFGSPSAKAIGFRGFARRLLFFVLLTVSFDCCPFDCPHPNCLRL